MFPLPQPVLFQEHRPLGGGLDPQGGQKDRRENHQPGKSCGHVQPPPDEPGNFFHRGLLGDFGAEAGIGPLPVSSVSARNPGLGPTGAARIFLRKNTRRLFLHVQIILNGGDPFDGFRDFHRFIDGLLRINETAQLNDALVCFDTDLK